MCCEVVLRKGVTLCHLYNGVVVGVISGGLCSQKLLQVLINFCVAWLTKSIYDPSISLITIGSTCTILIKHNQLLNLLHDSFPLHTVGDVEKIMHFILWLELIFPQTTQSLNM